MTALESWLGHQGASQPDLRVRVRGERVALGRSEVRAVGNSLAHRRVRIGGQEGHHVGVQAGAADDRRAQCRRLPSLPLPLAPGRRR